MLPASLALVLAAGWAVVKSLADVYTSTRTLICYAQGDKEGGAAWAERGLKDGMTWLGKKIDEGVYKITGKEMNIFANIFTNI
jgi:hypothetical protein